MRNADNGGMSLQKCGTGNIWKISNPSIIKLKITLKINLKKKNLKNQLK